MKNYFYILMLFFNYFAYAQTTPEWEWVKSAGGTSYDGGRNIVHDNNNNIIIAGYFQSPTITFDNITLNNSTSDINSDYFITKYDSSGNVLWAKKIGGIYFKYIASIATDINNNIIVCGKFKTSINLESITLSDSTNKDDLFIAKYDSDGNLLWAKIAGNAKSLLPLKMITNFQGNIYIIGSFQGTNINFDNYNLISNDTINGNNFLVSYNPSGNAIMAKKWSSGIRDISIDTTGLYITFDSLSRNYYAKCDFNGNFVWKKYVNGTINTTYFKIICNNSNCSYLVGDYSSSVSFGNIILDQPINNAINMYITKLDINGNALWAKYIEGVGGTYSGRSPRVNGISTDKNGNAYIVGTFDWRYLILDTIVVEGHSLNYQQYNTFVVEYSSNGNIVWVKSVVGDNTGKGNGGCDITNDILGNSYITGSASSTAYFDNLTLDYSNNSSSIMFFAKISSATGINNNIINSSRIKVFPSPASEYLMVELTDFSPLNKTTLEIYSLNGKLFRKMPIFQKTNQTDVSSLPSGVYILKIMNEKIIMTNKFVKE